MDDPGITSREQLSSTWEAVTQNLDKRYGEGVELKERKTD